MVALYLIWEYDIIYIAISSEKIKIKVGVNKNN